MISVQQDLLSSQTSVNPILAGPPQSTAFPYSLSLWPASASLHTMAYPLETAPHHRPPPITIHTDNGPKDLETSTFSVLPMSPTRSPTSPSFSGRPRGGKRIKSPPPSQSPIPSKALQSDLEAFAEQCRLWCVNFIFFAQMHFERSYLIGTITKMRRPVV